MQAVIKKKKKIKNIRNIRIQGRSELRIGRIQELNRRTPPQKKNFFRKEEIRRRTRKKRLQITQKMSAKDKED